jgi:ABC-2 type transport system ATP-binding protein
MRQKLGIILALAHAPRLLVLDEPTSGLDPLMQQALREVLREGARRGQTVFFSSHSLPEVEELCDQVAIVRDGEIVANESLNLLRERAGHEVMIRWRSESPWRSLEPPSFLNLLRRQDALWEGRLDGPVQPLLDFLSGKQVDDLRIGRPDLEGLFRRFYERQPGTKP